MKQFQFEYRETEIFTKQLSDFKKQCDVDKIYSEVLEKEVIRGVCDSIEQFFPDTPYMGCSTSGNIIDCELSHDITVVCTAFELPDTQLKLFQYDLAKEPVDDITAAIVEETKKNPWVKAIEMFFTIPEGSTTRFCDEFRFSVVFPAVTILRVTTVSSFQKTADFPKVLLL